MGSKVGEVWCSRRLRRKSKGVWRMSLGEFKEGKRRRNTQNKYEQ